MTCGIYILKFNNTNKVYVGLSQNIENRYRGHLYSLKNGISNKKLIEAYTLYGVPTYEVICECVKEELEEAEQEAINIYDSINNGFNEREAGATGASPSIRGEGNAKSKHTNDTYIKIFKDILYTKLSYIEIADKYNVSVQIVDHIALGISHKDWLQDKFPEEYALLKETIKKRKEISVSLINKITGEKVLVTSLLEFSKKTGVPKSSLSSLCTGRYASAGDWKLETPISYNPKNKLTYTIENIETKEEITFKNVSGFCRDNNISNRKGFTKFLKTEGINSIYLNMWKLISIS